MQIIGTIIIFITFWLILYGGKRHLYPSDAFIDGIEVAIIVIFAGLLLFGVSLAVSEN